MDTQNLHLSKIKTHVPGLDELFYGGLRLPDPHESKDMDGICIIIRGKQGVAKSDMAIQIMRGVTKSLAKADDKEGSLQPFFCTLNHRRSEWKKKYRSLEVMETIEAIKLPSRSTTCKLCHYFMNLQRMVGCEKTITMPSQEGCNADAIEQCKVCKYVQQEIITYNPRSQSIHWNVEGSSSEKNYISSLQEESNGIILTNEIFPPEEWYGESVAYSPQPLYIFNKMKQHIHEAKENLYKSEDGSNNFHWSSVVVEGFSILEMEYLERLPYIDLIDDLRKVAAVSILVFDERAEKLQLKSDIIIEMRVSENNPYKYMYRDMQIVKSDLQERIRGWHKVSMNHDIKAHVYPNISALMARRFSKENAVVRMQRNRLDYPQSLLERVWMAYAETGIKNEKNIPDSMPKLVTSIINNKEDKGKAYKQNNTSVRVEMVRDGELDDLMVKLKAEVQGRDTAVAYLLLGKTEHNLRKRVSDDAFTPENLKYMHFWEINIAYLWPEMMADYLKQYIHHWMLLGKEHTLHIVMDDFAYINQYPFMEDEQMLIPALINICDNETALTGSAKGKRDVNVMLSLVCTSRNSSHYHTIEQVSTIYNQY